MLSLHRLRPDEAELFAALAAMADHVAGTAESLRDYLDDPRQPAPETHARRLHLDALSADVDRWIIDAFITPIDPDDLAQLNAGLHALGDAIDDAARLFAVLHLEGRREDAVRLASLLTNATSQLRHAIAHLEDSRVLAGANARIMESMRDADEVYHSAAASLLEGSDVVVILKWQDVFHRLEGLLRTVGRAGKLLQRVGAKSQA